MGLVATQYRAEQLITDPLAAAKSYVLYAVDSVGRGAAR